jgi:Ca2+-transporting ATPase
VERSSIFTRVSPELKVRLVKAFQHTGGVVAMLGDGVNDAAALRQSNIGVAMGLRGTDLAKEAADMILADDRFATIGAAIEEGRVIHDNVRKAVLYLLACNVAELVVVFAATAVGWPAPLRPLQILWLNLLTDSVPALALALEPGEPDVMQRPPHDPRAPLLPRPAVRAALGYAALIAGGTLGAFAWGLHYRADPAHAATLAFFTLALAQIFHLGNARQAGHVTSIPRALTNPAALLAVLVTLALQSATALAPPLVALLHIRPLDVTDWAVVLVLGLLPALVGQGVKLARRSPPPEPRHRPS